MSYRDKERKVIKPFHATVSFYTLESTKTSGFQGVQKETVA